MIQFVELGIQQDKIKADLNARIAKVLSHGKYILGPEVQELEEKLANFVGVKHCIACASGTDALLIALMALKIGKGDEVITTAFTYVATGEVIARLGAKPVFVDIDPKTYNIDPNKIESAITEKTKAIMPVSLYGQCADFEKINAIAKRYNLPVIEDGAQSFGATQNGKYSCGLTTIGCTSFFPTKPLGCYGDGGACFTNDDELAKDMIMIHKHGQDRRYHHVRMGLNSRLDTIQAAVLLAKFEIFEQEIKQRIAAGNKYNEKLKDVAEIVTPYTEQGNTNVYAQYTIQVDNREKFQAALKNSNVPTAVHYPIPLNQQPMFEYLDTKFNVPLAENVAKRVVSLPMSGWIEDETIERVVYAVKKAVKGDLTSDENRGRRVFTIINCLPPIIPNLINRNCPLHMEETISSNKNLEKNSGGKVLMVAYYFPPLSGSGVFRSIKFAKYLSLFNWKPTVISTDTPPIYWNYFDESQVAEIPKDVEVFRIHDKFNEETVSGYTIQRANEILNFSFDVIRNNEKAADIFVPLTQVQQGVSRLLQIPCMALSWAYDAFNYIDSNIDINKFDVIYTTSGPYSSHIIGYYISKKYNIPWVADWRDQWIDNLGEHHDLRNPIDQISFAFEKAFLHQSNCNITVVEDAVPMYINNFSLPKEKIECITNGYDEADFTEFSNLLKPTKKFTINYSGLLYMQERNITPILKILKDMISTKLIDKNDIQFRIVGRSNLDNIQIARQFDLESIMVQTGYVSHKEAIASNINSDLLILLVGNEEKHKLVYTGKFFDYLRSGRPILALAPKDGVVDQVLRKTGHGKAFLSTQTSKIKNMILNEYLRWKDNKNIKRLYSPKIKKFERKVLTSQLADILERVKSNT